MKRVITLAFVALFLLGGINHANAQRNWRGHAEHSNRNHYEQYDGHRDNHRQNYYYRNDHYNRPNYHRYYQRRENYYRRYARQRNIRYRDYDSWYYTPRFYHRNEYVYFPGYQTYFDPYRRVYIQSVNGRWVYSSVMPRVLVGVNFGNVSVQFMSRLPF